MSDEERVIPCHDFMEFSVRETKLWNINSLHIRTRWHSCGKMTTILCWHWTN